MMVRSREIRITASRANKMKRNMIGYYHNKKGEAAMQPPHPFLYVVDPAIAYFVRGFLGALLSAPAALYWVFTFSPSCASISFDG
jgi:hypothetical protein